VERHAGCWPGGVGAIRSGVWWTRKGKGERRLSWRGLAMRGRCCKRLADGLELRLRYGPDGARMLWSPMLLQRTAARMPRRPVREPVHPCPDDSSVLLRKLVCDVQDRRVSGSHRSTLNSACRCYAGHRSALRVVEESVARSGVERSSGDHQPPLPIYSYLFTQPASGDPS
jgi:hypothetical protein